MSQYDKFADEYAQKTVALEKKMRQGFYSFLPSLDHKSVLDVGCGCGHDAAFYVKAGAAVSGIDISKKQIAMAQSAVKGNFAIGSMEKLPYAAHSFDVVTSVYALQASTTPSVVLKEMIRVVKPQGIVQVLTKHPIRNLLERSVNNGVHDYYAKGNVTSFIFGGSLELSEPGHTLMDYLTPSVLKRARLLRFEEDSDFHACAQLMGLKYPTQMIMQFQKI